MFHRYLRYAPDISWLASRSQSLLLQARSGDTRPDTEFILGFAAAGYADPANAFPRMQDRQTAAQHRQPRMAGQTDLQAFIVTHALHPLAGCKAEAGGGVGLVQGELFGMQEAPGMRRKARVLPWLSTTAACTRMPSCSARSSPRPTPCAAAAQLSRWGWATRPGALMVQLPGSLPGRQFPARAPGRHQHRRCTSPVVAPGYSARAPAPDQRRVPRPATG